MILRIYTKAFINKSGLGKEDCKEMNFSIIHLCSIYHSKITNIIIPVDCALLSWAGFMVFNAFSLWMLQVGYGVHQWDVHAVDGMHLAQVSFFM